MRKRAHRQTSRHPGGGMSRHLCRGGWVTYYLTRHICRCTYDAVTCRSSPSHSYMRRISSRQKFQRGRGDDFGRAAIYAAGCWIRAWSAPVAFRRRTVARAPQVAHAVCRPPGDNLRASSGKNCAKCESIWTVRAQLRSPGAWSRRSARVRRAAFGCAARKSGMGGGRCLFPRHCRPELGAEKIAANGNIRHKPDDYGLVRPRKKGAVQWLRSPRFRK